MMAINTIHLLNDIWADSVSETETLPLEDKRMIKKHHTRQLLYYDTLKQIYANIYSGNYAKILVMREYLLKFGNGIIEDTLESEAYDEGVYLKECDDLKHKLNMVDTWISAVCIK